MFEQQGRRVEQNPPQHRARVCSPLVASCLSRLIVDEDEANTTRARKRTGILDWFGVLVRGSSKARCRNTRFERFVTLENVGGEVEFVFFLWVDLDREECVTRSVSKVVRLWSALDSQVVVYSNM